MADLTKAINKVLMTETNQFEQANALEKIAEIFAHAFGTWFYCTCDIRLGGHFEFRGQIYSMDKAVQVFKDNQQKT